MSQLYQLSFRTRIRYEEPEPGIPLRVVLNAGSESVDCLARIDTGAAACLFQREVGESLGLAVEAGLPKQFSTLAGPLPAFGHEVTMQAAGLTYQATVFFAEAYDLPRNLLGKFGWLQQVRLGIVDYDEEVYLSAYDDPS